MDRCPDCVHSTDVDCGCTCCTGGMVTQMFTFEQLLRDGTVWATVSMRGSDISDAARRCNWPVAQLRWIGG